MSDEKDCDICGATIWKIDHVKAGCEMVRDARKKKLPPDSYEQSPIYLLWVRKERENGLENVDLRAVDTNRTLIELHRSVIIRDEPDATGVWIEDRARNHLYAQRDVRLAFRLTSKRESGDVWVRDEWDS